MCRIVRGYLAPLDGVPLSPPRMVEKQDEVRLFLRFVSLSTNQPPYI